MESVQTITVSVTLVGLDLSVTRVVTWSVQMVGSLALIATIPKLCPISCITILSIFKGPTFRMSNDLFFLEELL